MPKISIVLPVYNGATYLQDAIDSVLGQTISDFELIIVDDCSTDDSSKIAQRNADIDSRIRYVQNKTNLKLPGALNKGFSHAKGEYWTWTSCDNLYKPNALEELLNVLEKNKQVGLVYASMQLINENDEIIGALNAGPPEDLIFRNVVGACFLYRKIMAEKVGSYDTALFLCEDYEYWLRIALLSEIKPISTYLYLYRNHPESLSSKRQKDIITRGIGIQRKYFSKFIKTKEQAALFYAYLRARDIYNPYRQFYLVAVLFYSPIVFLKEVYGLISRRLKPNHH